MSPFSSRNLALNCSRETLTSFSASSYSCRRILVSSLPFRPRKNIRRRATALDPGTGRSYPVVDHLHDGPIHPPHAGDLLVGGARHPVVRHVVFRRWGCVAELVFKLGREEKSDVEVEEMAEVGGRLGFCAGMVARSSGRERKKKHFGFSLAGPCAARISTVPA